MLPNLRKIKDSKVVVIGSIAHNYTKYNFNDIQLVSEKRFSKIYGNSKRFLMFSLYKLFENSSYEEFSFCHDMWYNSNKYNKLGGKNHG